MKDWHKILLGLGIIVAAVAWINYAEDPTGKNLRAAIANTITL